MKIDQLFPGTYLKAADFSNPRTMTIKTVAVEPVGDEKTPKPIVFFHEETRGWVLNKTNASMIAHIYGPDTDGWLSRQIVLYAEPVSFQGKIVEGIRCRAPQPPAAAPVTAPAAPGPNAAPTTVVQPATASEQPQGFTDLESADLDY